MLADGGMAKAVAAGWPKAMIEEASAGRAARVDMGEDVIVGVNKYKLAEEDEIDILDVDNVAVRESQIARIKTSKAGRDEAKCRAALDALREGARGSENVLGLADPDAEVFHWVIDFPLFQRDEDTGHWTFLHHPFTAPIAGDEDFEDDPGAAKSQHYDLIWNGWELGSGSIRIHRSDVQAAVFRTMGMSDEEANGKFGFLLEALEMGAPPHGGFAMGLERFVALMAGEPDIRQIVAFPKVSSGADPLTGAPTPMPAEVLRELGIEAVPTEAESEGD